LVAWNDCGFNPQSVRVIDGDLSNRWLGSLSFSSIDLPWMRLGGRLQVPAIYSVSYHLAQGRAVNGDSSRHRSFKPPAKVQWPRASASGR
jgi:hypothetical protein